MFHRIRGFCQNGFFKTSNKVARDCIFVRKSAQVLTEIWPVKQIPLAEFGFKPHNIWAAAGVAICLCLQHCFNRLKTEIDQAT